MRICTVLLESKLCYLVRNSYDISLAATLAPHIPHIFHVVLTVGTSCLICSLTHLIRSHCALPQESKLRDLVHKYSEFIHFPIYMWTEKEVDVPVEEEEGEEAPAEQAGGFGCAAGYPKTSEKVLNLIHFHA